MERDSIPSWVSLDQAEQLGQAGADQPERPALVVPRLVARQAPKARSSTSRRARANASGNAGSTGLSVRSASCSCATRHSACWRSSIESGRSAVTAGGAFREIDRRAAIRAIDVCDVLAELGDLLRRQRLDEILLLQEVEERDQAAVIVGAAEIFEAGRALHVLRAAELRACSADTSPGRDPATTGASDPLADQAEHAERGARGELQVLTHVEPQRLAAARTRRPRPRGQGGHRACASASALTQRGQFIERACASS